MPGGVRAYLVHPLVREARIGRDGWQILWSAAKKPVTPRYSLRTWCAPKIARNKFWLYITNALLTHESVHCQVEVQALPGVPGVVTWLYVTGIERPYLVGTVENDVPLYDAHYLEPGHVVRFKTEHINRVLLTHD